MFIKFKMFGYLKKRKVLKDTSLEIHTPLQAKQVLKIEHASISQNCFLIAQTMSKH